MAKQRVASCSGGQSLARPTALRNAGLIPDGNRRWAERQRVDYLTAYGITMRVLAEVIDEFFQTAAQLENLVIYMISKRNLSRHRFDLEAVLRSETHFCNAELPPLVDKHSLRVVSVGLDIIPTMSIPGLSDQVRKEFVDAFESARGLSGASSSKGLYLLAGYDPFDELSVVRSQAQPARPLQMADLLIPFSLDLVVRTAGEKRLSDFPPLQSGYAEFVFFEQYFQDISREDIQDAISQYQARTRTFGS